MHERLKKLTFLLGVSILVECPVSKLFILPKFAIHAYKAFDKSRENFGVTNLLSSQTSVIIISYFASGFIRKFCIKNMCYNNWLRLILDLTVAIQIKQSHIHDLKIKTTRSVGRIHTQNRT